MTIYPWHTPFPILNQSVVPCPVLTIAALPAYFPQEAGKVFWYSHLYNNFPVCCDSHKGFSVFNEEEVVVFLESLCFFYAFLESLCFFYNPVVCNLIFGSSALSISNLYNWKFSIHVLLEPGLKDFEHYLASTWNEHKCEVIWTFFGIALLWNWNENWPFQSCGHYWVFQICWHIECSSLTASSFRTWNSSAGFPSPPLVLLVVMLLKVYLTSHSR